MPRSTEGQDLTYVSVDFSCECDIDYFLNLGMHGGKGLPFLGIFNCFDICNL